MPIDIEKEEIITIGEARRLVPPRGVSPATFARWLQRGVGPRRIKPETIRIAARRLTSREAMARFFAAQNESESPVPTISAKQRRKQAETADRLLAEVLSATNSPVPLITPSQRRKQKVSSDDTFSKPTAETADRLLQEAGI